MLCGLLHVEGHAVAKGWYFAPVYFKIVGIDHKLQGLIINIYHEKDIKYIAKSLNQGKKSKRYSKYVTIFVIANVKEAQCTEDNPCISLRRRSLI